MRIKKVVSVMLVLSLLAVCPAAAVADEGEGKLLFKYDPATAARDFKFYDRGHWTFDENGISCDNDGRTGDDAWYYTYTGVDQGWTDYVIEADFTDVGEGGIIFRTTNPTDDTVDAFDGYYIGTDSDYLFAGMDLDDAWHTIADDGPDASAAYKIGYKASMHWKIVVCGNTFTLYLDNGKFPTIQVCDDTYKSGGIAIRYRVYPGDLSGFISNLTVRELTGEDGSDVPSQPAGTQTQEPAGEAGQPTSEAVPSAADDNDMPGWLLPVIIGGGILLAGIPMVFALTSRKKKSE